MKNKIFQDPFFLKNKDNKYFFRTMKITTLLLMICLSSVYAGNTYSQETKISLRQKDVQLEKVLSEIEQKTSYLFVYNNEVNVKRTVSIDASDQPVSKILNGIFKDTNISYTLEGSHIILSLRNQQETSINNPKQANKTVTGIVKDLNDEPLIGVSVTIKGSTNATITDLDGKYTLSVPSNATLVFTYVGYHPQEIIVGGKSVIDITLKENDVLLVDVVVTALGIRKETKALTYNVQKVSAEDITAVKDANFINGLSGKVAGVTINQSASGIGGSTRVVMRGTKSLFGDNNALYVIDGVPILNTKNDQPTALYESPDGGDGDAISFLNSDDIADISVLSGAAAAALYGSQGANGVILITTKKGGEGKLKINYSNSSMFMNPFIMPKFQNRYGTRGDGFNSWGEKNDNLKAYDPKDFFETAYTQINSLSGSVGTERSQTYVSVANTLAGGLIKNNDLNRLNLNIRNTTDLIKDKLSLDMTLSYSRQKDKNMLTQGQYHNPLLPLYLYPRGADFERIKIYERHNGQRNFDTQYWPYSNMGLGMQNPYWIANREEFKNKTDRYSYTGTLKYDIIKGLNIAGRLRMDNTENEYTKKISASSDLLFASENGHYMIRKRSNRQIYGDILANLDKRFYQDKISLTATLGTSIMDSKYSSAGFEGHLLTVPNLFTVHNIAMDDIQTKAIQGRYNDRTQAIFGTAQVGYNSMLYLDLTARNEWASTLAYTESKSFFYPSVGVSGIISEMIKMPNDIISFLKIRGSYSEVGNAPMRYVTTQQYEIDRGLLIMNPYLPATKLKPENTKAFEVGLNMKTFKDKISLDATYYNTNTYNQLFKIDSSPSETGYSYYYLNAGKVNNWGLELALNYRDKIGQVEFETGFTYTFNRNKVISLVPQGTIDPTSGKEMGMNSVIVSESDSYRMMLNEGDPMGDIYVYTLKKDLHGNVYVDPVTGSVTADSKNWIKAGNAAPKYNIGWRNNISYKGFDLGFVVDARVGGIVVSATEALMDRFGVSERSAKARDEGGVLVNGGRLNPESYYAVVGGGNTGILSEYVYSATNVRLREATLSYTFPKQWFKGYIDNLSLSLIGRNLLMIYNKAPFDPELTASTGTYYQGFDYFMQPSLRSLGFGVKVQF